MHVQAVSRQVVENMNPIPNTIVISIRDSGQTPVASLKEGWKARLYLQFDDVDPKPHQIDKVNTTSLIFFNEEQAKQILEFVDFYKPDGVVVNCEAGISRSVGVMLALDYIYNNNNRYNDKRFSLYNRHVSNLLLKVRYNTSW